MDGLSRFGYWDAKSHKLQPHSAQAVLQHTESLMQGEAASSCGQGSCNCGGGCNGECANGN